MHKAPINADTRTPKPAPEEPSEEPNVTRAGGKPAPRLLPNAGDQAHDVKQQAPLQDRLAAALPKPLHQEYAGAPHGEPHRPGQKVVLEGAKRPRGMPAVPSSPGPEPQTGPSVAIELPDSPVATARAAIVASFYRDYGEPGTMLQHPNGRSFALREDLAHGEVRTPHTISIPLPDGHATRHGADLVIELEKGAMLVVDILPAHVPIMELKAHAYDALQMRRLQRCFSVLVLVRTAGGMAQTQVEALAHGYDLVFGLPEDKAHSDFAFGALKSRVQTWLNAASR